MAKKQTRRSISVSRVTYERLKAFCEANNISMSQFVETRVGDFLTTDTSPTPAPRVVLSAPQRQAPAPAVMASDAGRPIQRANLQPEPRPTAVAAPAPVREERPVAAAPAQVPMTSAAARYAVEPPPPIIKPKQETAAPKPAEKKADQIFTF